MLNKALQYRKPLEPGLFNNKKEHYCSRKLLYCFPFDIKNGKHFTEVQGGVIETGKDQIKGSSNDWYTVQDFTSVRNENMQLVMAVPRCPYAVWLQ